MASWKCTVCNKLFDAKEPPVPCPVCKAGRETFVLVCETKTGFHHDTQNQVVIVGGGTAALEAARTLREKDSTAAITMLTAENYCPYNRPALGRVLTQATTCEELALVNVDFYTQQRINLRIGTLVAAVDDAHKTVLLSTGESLPYTKLLLATGANSFNPIQSNEGTIPVQVLRSFEDAQTLAKIAQNKRIVVVGGGILGVEAAMALHQCGCASLTIVEFATRILSLQADEEVSGRLRACLQALDMVIYTGLSVVTVDATGAVLSNGQHIEADFVLASMGVLSEISLAKSIGLSTARGVVVDSFMRTSKPDIWAAGDCAEYEGRVAGTAGAAAAMGRVAGASMAGEAAVAYKPVVPAAVFSCPGFSMLSAGKVAKSSESALYQNNETGAYRKLFFEEGHLVGSLFEKSANGAKSIQAIAQALPLAECMPFLAP